MKSFAFVGAGSEQCADICESEFFCIHSVFCSLVHFRYKTFADNIESYLDPARMLFDLNTHLWYITMQPEIPVDFFIDGFITHHVNTCLPK